MLVSKRTFQKAVGLRVEIRRQRQFACENLFQRHFFRLSLKRVLAGKHLPRQNTDCPPNARTLTFNIKNSQTR